MIGNFSHLTIFSFHMAKLISTIEGGCVVTNDDKLASKIRSIINHGMHGKYNHEYFGLNMRTTDINSSIGLSQINKIDEYIRIRQKIVKIYAPKNIKKDVVG